MKIFSLTATVALATSMSLNAGAQTRPDMPDVDMQPIQVSEHVYYVQAQAGITVTFDPALDQDEKIGPDGLRAGITDAPIRRLYISHYHADHMYGAQVFEDLGAEIIAPHGALRYLEGRTVGERLEERKVSLAPWVDENTRIVEPQRLLSGEERFQLGEVEFRAVNVGSAHSEGDLILFVETDRVLLSGDIIFEGRIPFLGSANSAEWLEILEDLAALDVAAIIPGHGQSAADPASLVVLTRDYLAYVREKMGEAVENWQPFDEAYEQTDWSDFIEYPAFFEANRRNAYGVYLSLEREALE